MKKAVILLSGGLDSSTTLAVAKSQGFECYALTIDYGQRNHAEIEAAKKVVASVGASEHRVIRLEINGWGASALTDHSLKVPDDFSDDIPITYVPARNTIFLSAALGWAEAIGAHDIFFGANVVDYSNYPDCREGYIEAFEQMANLGTRDGVEGRLFKIHAPLLTLDKAEIVALGRSLGVNYSLTLSCYNPAPSGEPCGKCDPCRFREKLVDVL